MFKSLMPKRTAWLLFALALTAEAAAARPIMIPSSLPPGVRFVPNVAYAPSGDLFHTGDLYLPPPGTANHAAVVIVHGGAWIGGSKWERGSVAFAELLAQHGFLAYSINYRLAGRGGEFPEDVRDVNAAVGFVMDKAKG
ncbi:MAG: alpha/beta hydrolase fold domain-containing protein, partial [Chloroflexi bacterium]|nr:alpha/beta hydrolase fold domain-containing protein [Chloroflexota bacterium]